MHKPPGPASASTANLPATPSAASEIVPQPAAQPIDPDGPWHAGEIQMQRMVGVADRMAETGKRLLRDHLTKQHQEFFPQLPFAVFGAVDDHGDVWATLRANHPGFLQSPDPFHLTVNLPRDPSDPADAGMHDGDAIGMIGIELHTRRRNRLNGRVSRPSDDVFAIRVRQSFGNCPQYIRLRDFKFTRNPLLPVPIPAETSSGLDERARAMIAAADTFFVATYVDRDDENREVDVSHRGGKPGFVHIDEDDTLTIPDFAGNLFFNTLGNIISNPKAGLVFANFDNGDVLQITGDAIVITEGVEIAAFQGAERLWRVFPRKVVWRKSALPVTWCPRCDGSNGISPNSLLTGDWETATRNLSAMERAKNWRNFRISKITKENHLIRSFHLEPADDAGILSFASGQHLPIRIRVPGFDTPLIRTYTLSSAPSDDHYRISVKREGTVSSHLHDILRVGDTIEVRAPTGDFCLDTDSKRPLVLLAGGIGITPMLSMIRHIVYDGLRTRGFRPTWLFYAARNLNDRAFDDEIREIVDAAQGNIRLVRVLGETTTATLGVDCEAAGVIDINLLRAVLPFDDFEFYLCGPPSFMQAIYNGLRDLNITDKRIHAEAFGPASLDRSPDKVSDLPKLPPPSNQPTEIAFAKSGRSAIWQPETGRSLLELAEDAGLSPEASCRGGSCGTCRTKIVQGRVTYKIRPGATISSEEALICCAVPAAPDVDNKDPLVLAL